MKTTVESSDDSLKKSHFHTNGSASAKALRQDLTWHMAPSEAGSECEVKS